MWSFCFSKTRELAGALKKKVVKHTDKPKVYAPEKSNGNFEKRIPDLLFNDYPYQTTINSGRKPAILD